MRHARGGRVLAAVAGVAFGGAGALAQAPAPPLPPGRLAVRPHVMATGTRTAQAGRQRPDSLQRAEVYVPPQCVGTRRCPLVVLVSGNLDRHAKLADQYGMIVLDVSVGPGTGPLQAIYDSRVTWDPGVPYLIDEVEDSATKVFDAAITQVLRRYAIDPDKIAITGNSNSGAYAFWLGRNNLDVFSRIVPTSPALGVPFAGWGPPNPKTQFYLSGGADSDDMGFFASALAFARSVRRDGHPVKLVLDMRYHIQGTDQDAACMWRWLSESWAAPAAGRGKVPAADAGPPLTVDAVKRLTAFWTRFKPVLDSVGKSVGLGHVKEFPGRIGRESVSLLMSDIPALATRYPSVSAALSAAGLTAQQAQAYRIALVCASTALQLREMQPTDNPIGSVASTSVLGRNVALLAAHPELLEPLQKRAMWSTP